MKNHIVAIITVLVDHLAAEVKLATKTVQKLHEPVLSLGAEMVEALGESKEFQAARKRAGAAAGELEESVVGLLRDVGVLPPPEAEQGAEQEPAEAVAAPKATSKAAQRKPCPAPPAEQAEMSAEPGQQAEEPSMWDTLKAFGEGKLTKAKAEA